MKRKGIAASRENSSMRKDRHKRIPTSRDRRCRWKPYAKSHCFVLHTFPIITRIGTNSHTEHRYRISYRRFLVFYPVFSLFYICRFAALKAVYYICTGFHYNAWHFI